MNKAKFILLVEKMQKRTLNVKAMSAMDIDTYHIIALDTRFPERHSFCHIVERNFKSLKDADAYISALSDERHGYISDAKIAAEIAKKPLEFRFTTWL